MALDKELVSEVNRTAYALAQQHYTAYRHELMTECKRLAVERKPLAEILAWLVRVTAPGKMG